MVTPSATPGWKKLGGGSGREAPIPYSASVPHCLLTDRSAGDGPPGYFPHLPGNSLSLRCRDSRVPTPKQRVKKAPQKWALPSSAV